MWFVLGLDDVLLSVMRSNWLKNLLICLETGSESIAEVSILLIDEAENGDKGPGISFTGTGFETVFNCLILDKDNLVALPEDKDSVVGVMFGFSCGFGFTRTLVSVAGFGAGIESGETFLVKFNTLWTSFLPDDVCATVAVLVLVVDLVILAEV
ncbi:hypothetical protein WICPIJ_005199 [Wickerhamomyces pijperi]|uniref:Uncharacterized protein n=1 Tax=Wickerhamomyces pijperi TaxID=599730 RepID=A0A9P8TM72_WICPI|nr:hypothetical protein WICPIJ_005199 [Wickerhamomyces pijperi]